MGKKDVQPGFYEAEDGTKRYWDGNQWLFPETKISTASVSSSGDEMLPNLPNKKPKFISTFVLVVVSLIIFGTYFVTQGPTKNSSSNVSDSNSTAVSVDRSWIPSGFESYDDNLAYRWKNPSKCKYSSMGCWGMEIVTKSGCPSNLYVAINILDSSSAVVGYSNDSLPSLAPLTKAKLEFADTSGESNPSGQISEINCF